MSQNKVKVKKPNYLFIPVLLNLIYRVALTQRQREAKLNEGTITLKLAKTKVQKTILNTLCQHHDLLYKLAHLKFQKRAAQRLNLSSKKRRRQHHHPDSEPPPFLTNFAEILRVSPPPVPPSLLRSVGRKENFSIGKVSCVVCFLLVVGSNVSSHGILGL
ncbi:hypothetical protein CDAR_578741 [Caerostris darwini]|uniref:Uncharacterized protein n=1 Tax=Caerostris darwini TaxID=1538125 RepID=A0AAV4UC36_9ARAC|nr:hypothetical protein CDAR_578741 [Caerostris darwini]